MKQLSGSRGWEYTYRKRLEDKLAMDVEFLADRAVEGNFQYLQGQIRGIRDAIELLDEVWEEYKLDDDADLAS